MSENGITYFAFNITFLKLSLVSTSEGPLDIIKNVPYFTPKAFHSQDIQF